MSFSGQAGPRRIRIDYRHTSGSARLSISWQPPGSAWAPPPMGRLGPRCGLVTSHTDADGTVTRIAYASPELGLATATVTDPDGLALRSTTGCETGSLADGRASRPSLAARA